MPDKVALLVNGQRIEEFTSYTVDADLYVAGDAFTLELADIDADIQEGMQCELEVNDKLELYGIIDKVVPSYDKSGSKFTVTGRDLMGWLVDAHCEEFITIKNSRFIDLAQRLLRNAPDKFFKLKHIEYSEDIIGRLKAKGAKVGIFDTLTPLSQIEAGMSVFEVLMQYAKSKGLLFDSTPAGNFVIGKPKETGNPEFFLINRKDGVGNNIKSGELTKDISKRYSKIIVVGQKQGQDVLNATQVNVEAVLEDPTFPFYKPFVLKDEYGGDQPKLQARMALEKMKHEGFRLSYTVDGHSQNTKNWTINELVQVKDEQKRFQLDGVFLLYGRTFEKAKGEQGTTTKLRLGLPGMIA